MWLMAMGLLLGGLAILGLSFPEWRGARNVNLGWMSQQWLAEYRAGRR